MSISVIPASAKTIMSTGKTRNSLFTDRAKMCRDSVKLRFDMIKYFVRLRNPGKKWRIVKIWLKSNFPIPKSLKR